MNTLSSDRGQDTDMPIVARWIRKLTGKKDNTAALSPPEAVIESPAYSPIAALSSSLPNHRDGLDKSVAFIIEYRADGASVTGNEHVEKFLSKMEEKTLRILTEFIDDKENGFIVRSMCATAISGMSFRYRERSSDYGIDYTNLYNIMLLGEDFVRSTPKNFLDEISTRVDYHTVRDITVRFSSLMDEIKPQNLSKTPNFWTLPELIQRAARVALIIANVYYTGADNGARHRESELLECVDRHFDRRFEITGILDRYMEATPKMIDEIMEDGAAALQEGWL